MDDIDGGGEGKSAKHIDTHLTKGYDRHDLTQAQMVTLDGPSAFPIVTSHYDPFRLLGCP